MRHKVYPYSFPMCLFVCVYMSGCVFSLILGRCSLVLSTWSNLDLFHIVELIQFQGVNALVNADCAWTCSAPRRSNGISRRILLLQLNIFVVLHDVLLNFFVVSTLCLLILHLIAWRPEHILRGVFLVFGLLSTRDFCLVHLSTWLFFLTFGGSNLGCGSWFGGLTIAHLLKQRNKKWRLVVWLLSGSWKSGLLDQFFPWDLVLVTLHGNFGQVNRQGVVHLVILEVLLDQQGYQTTVRVVMNFASYRVLPLKARTLFRVRVCVVLDGFEDLGTQLGSERSKGALLL